MHLDNPATSVAALVATTFLWALPAESVVLDLTGDQGSLTSYDVSGFNISQTNAGNGFSLDPFLGLFTSTNPASNLSLTQLNGGFFVLEGLTMISFNGGQGVEFAGYVSGQPVATDTFQNSGPGILEAFLPANLAGVEIDELRFVADQDTGANPSFPDITVPEPSPLAQHVSALALIATLQLVRQRRSGHRGESA